jgi:DNA-binding transcriptional ArsR family regulator
MDDRMDKVFSALADPTRRRVLDLLRERARTTGELAARCPGLSRFAVMKHLGVLEAAGLVIGRKEGRQRWNHLNAVPLREVYERWVSRFASDWAQGLLAIKRAAESGGQQ